MLIILADSVSMGIERPWHGTGYSDRGLILDFVQKHTLLVVEQLA